MPTKNTATLSLPKTKTVRGYEIKRLALGGYLQAIDLIQEFPTQLMNACFPGDDLHAIIEKLKRMDAGLLEAVLGGALLTAPKMVIRLAAGLTGIDEQQLLDDPEIGLDGLVEMLIAWVEVNRLGDFLPAVRKLIAKMRAAVGNSPQPTTGSNG